MKSLNQKGLEEASAYCRVPQEMILECIEEEWIRPSDMEGKLLDEEDLARVELIWELREDFGVNTEAIPIILHLIDQLNYVCLEFKRG